jgi:hypothetical protein
LANIFKNSRTISNFPIHGRGGVYFDAQDKATAMAESIEDQFSLNAADNKYQQHSNRSGEGCDYSEILASTLVLSQ